MAALDDAAYLDLLPLNAPPEGLLPNFTNPPDRSHQLFIVAGVCLSLIASFASLRFYAKFFLLRKRTKDDCNRPPESLDSEANRLSDAYVLSLVSFGRYSLRVNRRKTQSPRHLRSPL